VRQGRLADPRLTAQHDHSAAPTTSIIAGPATSRPGAAHTGGETYIERLLAFNAFSQPASRHLSADTWAYCNHKTKTQSIKTRPHNLIPRRRIAALRRPSMVCRLQPEKFFAAASLAGQRYSPAWHFDVPILQLAGMPFGGLR
jgi:hypothetical protein